MDETTVLQGLMARKLPTWAAAGLVCPHRLALEQCSGERTASYKGEVAARLFPNGGERMADLTGGLGVDFSILARHFTHALYVERQGALCETARRNFERLRLTQAEVTEGDGREVLRGMPHTDLIYMDPARRDSAGRKTVRIGDCEPDVKALLPLLWEKTDCVLLKLSPMLDLTLAARELGCVAEAHIVGDGGECKELLLVLRPDAGRYDIVCADGTHRFRFRPEEEEAAVAEMADDTGRYLYEPSAALLKAGAFKLTAARYGLRKLHPNTHLYTADHLVDGFPGRCFEVKGVTGFGKRALRDLCRSVEERANLTVRNFPGTVAELRKRLKLREGGDAYWFATTLADGRHVLIDCRKPDLHARGDETSGKDAPPHGGTTEAGTPYII